jgi:acyl carrier protein
MRDSGSDNLQSLISNLQIELRAFLQRQLPAYMVPSAFVVLEALPLTPNGKLDRRALPPPDQARLEQEHAYAVPRTALEEQLAAIWAEILGVERVGIYDNFFNLGGHSLQAARLRSRLCETFRVELPLRSFFEAPRVADLAVVIAQQQAERLESATLAQMLAELEQLSEDEAQTLLAAGD